MTQFSASGSAARHAAIVAAMLALGACKVGEIPAQDAADAHGDDAHHDAAHAPSEHGDKHASSEHGDAQAGHAEAAHEKTGHDDGHGDGHDDDHGAGAKADSAPHWDYASQHAWREVSSDAAACAVGGRQSPINLYDQPRADAPDLEFAYAGVEARFFNNGHTLQLAPPQGLALNAGGKIYSLLQAHFHAPSEHRIDGESFGLEVHFVHKTPDGRLGVVGVVFREGRENPALGALFAKIPAKIGEDQGLKVYFDPSAFLPAGRSYYQYDGSLTTPPCTEGVLWRVMREPIEASAAQIAAFKEVVGENARELQPINGRAVSYGD